jgi:threonine dehydratase
MLLSGSQTAVFRPADVWIARARLKNVILRTPLLFSPALSQRTGCQIYPKMDCRAL